ncbi:hypothetical protein [Pseudonocardia acaciae]|uniref:hypothetical protein n=1 Tax=Pseudonocardia acaciae TaxID=551276 RepID=UPI0004904871|nr:hypothetical protein [Pseudonocardia acaciae]
MDHSPPAVETPLLAGLVDDAALFPPGNAPPERAVPAHRSHLTSWYAAMVGPFVAPAARLAELLPLLSGAQALSVTFPEGPAGLAEVVRTVASAPGAHLASVEVAVPADVGASELVAALDEHLPDDVLGYVEIPRNGRGPAVLDALAGGRYRAKFRTGGLVPAAHPDERELAGSILAAVGRKLPFKCTAGLHHAVRHTDGELEQHGFLNVLLATDAALRGAGPDELAATLADRSGASVAGKIGAMPADRTAAARAAFGSFGTCDIADPLADLVALGIVRPPATEENTT